MIQNAGRSEGGRSMRRGKKGIAPGFLVALVIALAVAVVAAILVIRAKESGESVGKLSPTQDATCLQKTRLLGGASGEKPVDIDFDGRDDGCDWCVCDSNDCDNRHISEGGGDKDGDKLPAACDKDDTPGKGLAVTEFGNKCSKDNLVRVDNKVLCYISTSAARPK